MFVYASVCEIARYRGNRNGSRTGVHVVAISEAEISQIRSRTVDNYFKSAIVEYDRFSDIIHRIEFKGNHIFGESNSARSAVVPSRRTASAAGRDEQKT